jgi:hypothetical protein
MLEASGGAPMVCCCALAPHVISASKIVQQAAVI